MTDSQRRINLHAANNLCATCLCSILSISGYRCCRGYFGSTFCRRMGRKKHRQNTYRYAKHYSRCTDVKKRNFRKFSPDSVFHSKAHNPCYYDTKYNAYGNSCLTPVQCFQPYITGYLLFTHSDTTHHTKKLRSLSNITVHAARNHKNSRQHNQYKQDGCKRIQSLCITITTGSRYCKKSGILVYYFICQSIVFFYIIDALRYTVIR